MKNFGLCNSVDLIGKTFFGMLLASAALAKATNPIGPPTAWLWAGYTIELALASALLFGIYPKITSYLGIGTFSVFVLYLLIRYTGGARECDCFGAVHIPIGLMLCIDGGAILFFLWRVAYCQAAKRPWMVRGALVFFVIALLAGPAMRPSTQTLCDVGGQSLARNILLKPDEWTQQELPIIDHIAETNVREEMRVGVWLLVMIRSNCQSCKRIVGQLEVQGNDASYSIAVLDMEGQFRDDDFVSITLDRDHEWYCPVPRVLTIVGGQVVAVQHTL